MKEGKTILITGATSGIGESLARALAKEKDTLILAGRNRDKLYALKKELSEQCKKVHIHQAFFDQESSVHSFAVKCIGRDNEKKMDKPTVIINSAADFGITADMMKITNKDLLGAFKVNVLAPFMIAQHALPYMIEQKFGRIINIGSTGGLNGYALRTPYSISKGGLVLLTKSLNSEVHSGAYGLGLDIKAFCVCPGPVEGLRLRKQILERATCKEDTVDRIRKKFERIPGGILQPEIVVNKIISLLQEGDIHEDDDVITFN